MEGGPQAVEYGAAHGARDDHAGDTSMVNVKKSRPS
jgi:hypothetical protein